MICAGTSGYNNGCVVWMRQKRIQGSHFANLFQAKQANDMMINKLIKPLMSSVSNGANSGGSLKMMNNKHLLENIMTLVQAKLE